MDAAEAKRMSVGGDDMATSGTINGKSKRAPAEGVMDSDNPNQPTGKERRAEDLHLASVADKEVVKERAQW